MQIASCRLKVGINGSDIFISEMTPAEARILRVGHEVNAGGDPLSDVRIIGEKKIDSAQEYQRLARKYNNLRKDRDSKPIFSVIYPDEHAELPQTFEQVKVTIAGKGKPLTTGKDKKPVVTYHNTSFMPDIAIGDENDVNDPNAVTVEA